jgi:hypothetical protein
VGSNDPIGLSLLFSRKIKNFFTGGAMPTLDFKNRLNDFLHLRQMSVQTFAEIAKLEGISGASQAILFKVLRSANSSLPNDVVEQLEPLRTELETMCKEFEPFVLSLKDSGQVYSWLKAKRAGEVYAVVIDSTDSTSSENGEQPKEISNG